MRKPLRILFVVLVATTLLVVAPALALQETQAPEGSTTGEGGTGASVTATGVLERPEFTTYQYGEYAVTDEASGTLYALGGETVDLGAYIGERVTVTGSVVPGYEEGQVEGGPALLEVTAVEVAGGGSGSDTGGGEDGTASGTVMATFRLVVEGELPEDFSFYVEDSHGTGGVICTTDADVIRDAGYPECRDGGGTNEVSFPVPSGKPFDYRVLASRGVELSQQVVSEDSLSPTDDFTVDTTYTASGEGEDAGPDSGETGGAGGDQYDPQDPDSGDAGSGSPVEPDLNGDGVVDEADGEHAARVSEEGARATDDEEDPVLPDTGGLMPPILLAAGGLLAGLLIARLHTRRVL